MTDQDLNEGVAGVEVEEEEVVNVVAEGDVEDGVVNVVDREGDLVVDKEEDLVVDSTTKILDLNTIIKVDSMITITKVDLEEDLVRKINQQLKVVTDLVQEVVLVGDLVVVLEVMKIIMMKTEGVVEVVFVGDEVGVEVEDVDVVEIVNLIDVVEVIKGL